MRATQGTTYRHLQSELSRMATDLENLRVRAATGKKVNRPSDDPTAIRPILDVRGQLRSTDRFLKTTGLAIDRMQSIDGLLAGMENTLVRAKEVAINATNGTLDDESLGLLADQIHGMLSEIVDTGNAKIDGKYVFAGFEEATKPFTVNPAYPGDPRPYLYNGDINNTTLEISPGETIQTTIPGNELFMGDTDNDGTVDAGMVDMFGVLSRLEEAIRSNDKAAIQTEMDSVDTAANQNRRLRGRLGNNAARAEDALASMEEAKVNLKQSLSRYEDADIIETITSLTQQETAFEAALNVTSKVSRLSILDYI